MITVLRNTCDTIISLKNSPERQMHKSSEVTSAQEDEKFDDVSSPRVLRFGGSAKGVEGVLVLQFIASPII